MTLATGNDLGVALVEALGLPKMTCRLELIVEANEPVIVRTEQYVESEQGELIKQLAEYRLVPKD